MAAVRAAATLFTGRRLLVVSVWEPGLAMIPLGSPDATGLTLPPPSPEQLVAIDERQSSHAEATARAGAELARGLGADAEPLAVEDERDVARTLLALAAQHDADAVVVGSRGLGGLKSRVLGSTSKALLHDAHRPVLVVRAED